MTFTCDQLGICQNSVDPCPRQCRRAEMQAALQASKQAVARARQTAPPGASRQAATANDIESQRERAAKRYNDHGNFWLSTPAELSEQAGPDKQRHLALWQELVLLAILGLLMGAILGALGDDVVKAISRYAALLGLG